MPDASSTPSTASKERPVATIGAILPLSGVQAIYGQGIREGIDLAADGINATEDFSIRVKIVYEDTASDVKNAPAAAHKLISQDKAVVLITGLSPTSLAVAPIAEEKRVVLFTMASLATKLNTAGKFVFKNDDVSSKLGEGLAETARAKGVTSTAVAHANYNDSVVEAKDAFMKRFAALGGKVTGDQGFTQETTDFRTILGKLIVPGPSSFAVFGLQRDCALATRQLRDLGYRGMLFGFTCMDDPEVVAAAKDAVEGATFVSFNGPPTETFSKLVQAKYSHAPLRWSAEAFDGMKLIALALARSRATVGRFDSPSLRATMTEIRGYTGEAGHADFDQDGNATRTLYVKTVRNGKIELVK
jgi:branched-chain amino acid transport system substrate-binding protein